MVIAISTFQQLSIYELWIAFGIGNNFRYVLIHDIVKYLRPARSESLTAFHAFTVCDQTPSFSGRGKSTVWATWKVLEENTPAFVALGSMPTEDKLKKIIPSCTIGRAPAQLSMKHANICSPGKDALFRICYQRMEPC